MRTPKAFWGFSVAEILKMEYDSIEPTLLDASGLSIEAIVIDVTKRRAASKSDAETLACSRIISAMLNGPDVINF